LTMHQRENIVLIRPRANGLTLHTMFYENEVRKVEEYGKDGNIQLKDQEKKLALQLIDSLAAPFQPEKYHDSYQTALQGLIEAKLKGEEITEAPHPKLAPVIDLMDALKKSLAEKPHAPAAEPAAAATGKRPPLRAVPVPEAGEEPARGTRRKKKVG
jgi:DNA end-binding protein Ku